MYSLFVFISLFNYIEQHKTLVEPNGWCFFYAPVQQICSCLDDNNLLYLDCHGRNLSRVPELTEQSTWESVNISHNRLQTLFKYDFASLLIKKLDISNCELNELHAKSFYLSTGIEYLWLSNNNLSTIPSAIGLHLKSLKMLDLSNNPLLSISGFYDMLSHTHLTLHSLKINHIAKIDHNLDLTKFNKLHTLSAIAIHLKNAPCIDCSSGNQQRTINLPKQIRKLDLSMNNLTGFSEKKSFDNLEKLILKQNNFTKLFDKAPNLTYLDMSFNKIQILPSVSMNKLTGIIYLNLSNNEIKKVSSKFICKTQFITLIDLSSNLLKEFPICAIVSTSNSRSVGAQQLNTTAQQKLLLLQNNNISCSYSHPELNWTIRTDEMNKTMETNSTECDIQCSDDLCMGPDDDGEMILSFWLEPSHKSSSSTLVVRSRFYAFIIIISVFILFFNNVGGVIGCQ